MLKDLITQERMNRKLATVAQAEELSKMKQEYWKQKKEKA